MSAEIRVSASLAATKPTPATASSIIVSEAPAAITPTMNGNHYVHGSQLVGTADETIALGDIGTVGWVYFRNLDGTNYVTFGGDGTNYFDKLKAGEQMVKRWNGAAVHCKSNTASCIIEYLILED